MRDRATIFEGSRLRAIFGHQIAKGVDPGPEDSRPGTRINSNRIHTAFFFVLPLALPVIGSRNSTVIDGFYVRHNYSTLP